MGGYNDGNSSRGGNYGGGQYGSGNANRHRGGMGGSGNYGNQNRGGQHDEGFFDQMGNRIENMWNRATDWFNSDDDYNNRGGRR